MNIQVTNLSHNTVDSDLRKLFSFYGEVLSAEVLRDRINGRSRGTAFVDMINDAQGALAINGLHRTQLDGKAIAVSEKTYSPSTYKNSL
ncbi:MAG: RNA-binding protein [Chitinophagaceae bacterium]